MNRQWGGVSKSPRERFVHYPSMEPKRASPFSFGTKFRGRTLIPFTTRINMRELHPAGHRPTVLGTINTTTPSLKAGRLD